MRSDNSLEQIRNKLQDPLRSVGTRLTGDDTSPLVISGLSGSLPAFVLAYAFAQIHKPVLFVGSDRTVSTRIIDDIRLVAPEEQALLFSGKHSDGRGDEDVRTIQLLIGGSPGIVATTPAALRQKIANPKLLSRNFAVVAVDADFPMQKLLDELQHSGFQRDDYVKGRGEFAVRGGIVDLFPFVGEDPIRLEFIGDTIESIRLFDPLSQRSIREITQCTIVPDLLTPGEPESAASLFDYLPDDALVVIDDPDRIHREEPEPWDELQSKRFRQIHFRPLRSGGEIDFGALAQPAFNGSVKHLREKIVELQREDYTIVLTADSHSEEQRLQALLNEVDDVGHAGTAVDPSRLAFSLDSLHEGFVLPSLRIALFTEHQIFNRLKRIGKKKKVRGFSPEDVQKLQKGDYVVHMDYGVGVYDGLHRIRVREVEQEVVKLQYAEEDTLYVNLNYISRLQKYASKEGHLPRLTRLGSNEWDRLKARAKKKIKDIARDLIALYARRKNMDGFSFAQDTLWQKELEASFPYEDTFDQAKATRDVKEDMEAASPMDRLICGDVGFGKTEVAVRAAFKAVMNGKQVAVLVPTTILAMQHYNTFKDRMSRYATRVQVLSRFKSKKEQVEILHQLRTGAIDVVIGTHRLLSKDVRLKNLGLLIVDEEHRFGVTAKEKLRQLKAEVDTLTLTATPIPRTLHFSLMGARDLSIIATPPRNRLPVITEIAQQNDTLTKSAILREVQRKGQVYFVHDRVQNIDEVTARLQALIPSVRFHSAHGQMPGHQLEQVMLDFLEKRFDVLVCTKIIESGLDIPNANTIIINRADRFGMAELYQLRGRVGRSNTQAFAYLLTPPLSSLPKGTIQRLQAVEEHTDLGSGFHLAMRDLEIRGTGNLLGAEQSGFIDDIGFETYTRVLEEAVAELKSEEFRDLFARETLEHKSDAIVEADLDALIPEDYVGHPSERFTLYRKLYGVKTAEQLQETADELRDRFGPHPPQVKNLLEVIRIKLIAGKNGFAKITVSPETIEVEFPPESASAFYEGAAFQEMMTRIGEMRSEGVALRQSGKILKLISPVRGDDPCSYTLELLGRLAVPGRQGVASEAS